MERRLQTAAALQREAARVTSVHRTRGLETGTIADTGAGAEDTAPLHLSLH